jgi:tetratricopeptide (TPR) repeat protein
MVLRMATVRAVVGGLLVSLAGLIFVALTPSLSLRDALRGALGGAVLGSIPLFLPGVVEGLLLRHTRRSLTRGVLALYAAALVGWLLALVQFAYVFALLDERSVGPATARVLSDLRIHAPKLLLLHVLFPGAIALAGVRRMGWLQTKSCLGWAIALAVVVACGVAGTRVDRPAAVFLLAPILFVLITVAVGLVNFLSALAQATLWQGDQSPRDDLIRVDIGGPPPPLALSDRILMGGGPAMFLGSLCWLGLGVIAVPRLGWSAGVACALAWFTHLVLASNLPQVHLARGKPRHALDLARWLLHHHANKRTPAQGRLIRLHRRTEVRALLNLKRIEEALPLLPECVPPPTAEPGLGDHIATLRLAQALAQAGCPQECLGLLDSVPRESKRGVDIGFQADVLQGVALHALDRSSEALEITRSLLSSSSARGKARAVVQNNLAMYRLAVGDNPQEARAWGEEAYRVLGAKHAAIATTYGACLLHTGEPDQALPLLARGKNPDVSPHGRAWVHLQLGLCYESLERMDEARAEYRLACDALPNSAPGENARQRLTDLG